MSYFAAALDSLMDERGMTQTELQKLTGIGQARISRYLNEGVSPDHEAVEKIAGAFGAKGLNLVAAYLHDQTPEKFQGAFSIERRGAAKAREAEKLPAIFERLPARVRTLLEAAALECERQPDFVKVIESALALARR